MQDEEDLKAIVRLFADLGDSYVELIATGNISYSFYYSYVREITVASLLIIEVIYTSSPQTRFHLFWLIIHLTASTIYAGSNDSMLIVHALLEVTSHPEYDIASMTFNFWHNLQISLIERYALQVPFQFFSHWILKITDLILQGFLCISWN